MEKPFLTAEWRNLIIANFPAPRELLEPFVPAGTQLDTYQGKPYVSLVAFQFLKTRVFGIPFPFHTDFPELNLRFYVRRFSGEEWRHGVVFIKEIVPKWAVAAVARLTYGEKYLALPMTEAVSAAAGEEGEWSAEFGCGEGDRVLRARAVVAGPAVAIKPGSREEFFCENYWGYSRLRGGRVLEYQVEHVPWRVWQPREFSLQCDFKSVVGPELAEIVNGKPESVIVADGAPVSIYPGRPI